MRVLLADGTDKTAWMVCLAQGGHNFPFNEFLTTEAAGAIESLIIQSADILALPHKKSSLSQVTSTNCRKRERELIFNDNINCPEFVIHSCQLNR